MTVEDNVFLLGFIGVYPVDGLRDTLKLLFGDSVAAVGETLMVTTQAVKILTAVPKLQAAVIAVARVVLVVGFPAAALAGAW